MFRELFSIQNESRGTRFTVIAIMLAFLCVCTATSLFYGDRLLLGDLQEFLNDDVKYLRSAETLIETGVLTYKNPDKPTVFIMPGIVFMLVPFVKLFGMAGAIMPFRIFEAFMQTISLYLLYLIARRIFNGKIALISLAVTACYIPNIYVTTLILTEVPFLFFFSLLLLLMLFAVDKKEMKYYIVGGFVWGICALFRPTIATYPIVILVFWLIRKYKPLEMLKYTCAASMCFMIVLAPWWIRNYVVFQQFIPFTLATGNPALQGAFIGGKVDAELLKTVYTSDTEYSGDEINDNRTEAILADRVFKHNLRNNTIEFIQWLTIGKTIDNFKSPFVWHEILGMSFKAMLIQHLLILVVSALGLGLLLLKRNLNGYGWFLYATAAYFNCIHLPFYCFSRYVYPIMPLLIIGAVYLVAGMRVRE